MVRFDEIIYKKLTDAGVEIAKDVSARTLSTFGSGGFVDYVVYPKNAEEVLTCVSAFEFKHVLGGGSNVLISDNGLNAVLSMKKLKGYAFDGDILRASAGEYLPLLSKAAYERELSGLEFACGIPATVGGAVKMNAGAFGKEMAGVLKSVTLLKNGEIVSTTPTELKMRYRDGRIGSAIVIEAELKLTSREKEKIEYEMRENDAARRRSQPKEPSLGSVFKRTGATAPAVYIQGCGLKGVRIGGAAVSGVHSNFIINMGGATSRDYLRLVDKIKNEVRARYAVELEEEFVFLRD